MKLLGMINKGQISEQALVNVQRSYLTERSRLEVAEPTMSRKEFVNAMNHINACIATITLIIQYREAKGA